MTEQNTNKTYFQKVRNNIMFSAYIGALSGFIAGGLIQNHRTMDEYQTKMEAARDYERLVIGKLHQEDLGEKALTGSLIGAGLGAIVSGLYAARKK